MTSAAFILGAVPLAVSSGAGAASRHSIGTGVIGGMLAATFVAVLFVPLFYVVVSRRRKERTEPLDRAAACLSRSPSRSGSCPLGCRFS